MLGFAVTGTEIRYSVTLTLSACYTDPADVAGLLIVGTDGRGPPR